jgi:HAD superfamily hydrolase (TIGR01509 family)
MPLRAILFDLDDTLVSTSAADALRMAEVLELAGTWPGVPVAEFAERYRRVDLEHRELVDSGRLGYGEYRRRRVRLATAPWVALDDAQLEAYEGVCDASIGRCTLLPGAVQAIAAARTAGLATGLLTNGPADVQRRKLQLTGLDHLLDAVVISAEHGVTKPAAELYAIACDTVGVAPAEAAMVGDSLANDVQGALAAGLAAAWITPTAGEPPPPAIRAADAAEAVARLLAADA